MEVVTEDSDSDGGSFVRDFLAEACILLAFLTDFARDWIPAKNCLGERAMQLWAPLLHFLSLAEAHPRLVPPHELEFIQSVAIQFFRAVVEGNIVNKTIFGRQLANSIRGVFGFESRDKFPPRLEAACFTSLTYRLLVELVLDTEHCTIALQEPTTSRVKTPPSPLLPLPLTHSSPAFHPSLSVSRQSYLVSLPVSATLSQLASLCQPQLVSHTKQRPVKILVTPQPPEVKFSLPARTGCLTWNTKLSALLHLTSSTQLAVLPLTVHTTKGAPLFIPLREGNTTLLGAFTGSGGLCLLSQCLPSLLPSLWSTVSYSDLPPSLPPFHGHPPFSLGDHTLHSLPPHTLITFGMCLRLESYCKRLMNDPQMARPLLTMLLGAEVKGQFNTSQNICPISYNLCF